MADFTFIVPFLKFSTPDINFGSGNFSPFYLNLNLNMVLLATSTRDITPTLKQKIYKIIIKAKTNKI